jgi:hypothetical protein
MNFFNLTTATLLYGSDSLSISLFFVSAFLLLAGIVLQVRSRVTRLTAIEYKPLNWIELSHPHLPSARIITTIAICTATLLLVGLQTMNRTFPFNDPYQGLNLVSLFLLGGAVGIMAELRWKHAGEYACAVLVGTALAFILLILRFNYSGDFLTRIIVPFVLLVPSVLLAGQTVARDHRRPVLLTVLLAFSFWILIYIGQ